MAKNKNSNPAKSSASETSPDKVENVSLGPACGVVMIFACVICSIGIAVAALLLFGKQDKMAQSALRDQLIPWVEQSQLSDTDKNRIVGRLTELSSQIEQGKVDTRQLDRVRTRVSQNPVLQWAPIEQTIQYAQKDPSFTDAEREQLQKISDRLLQACSQFQVRMEDLGFILQSLATQEAKSNRLVLKPQITHDEVVTYMQRAEQMLDKRGFKLDESLEHQSVSQVFDRQIDQALDVNEHLLY